ADNGHELAVLDDRDVPDAPLGHLCREVAHLVLGGAGVHVRGHDRADRFLEHCHAQAVQPPDDVTLGDDALDCLVPAGDDHGTDAVVGQEGEQVCHRVVRGDGDDIRALVAQNIRDLHASTLVLPRAQWKTSPYGGSAIDPGGAVPRGCP